MKDIAKEDPTTSLKNISQDQNQIKIKDIASASNLMNLEKWIQRLLPELIQALYIFRALLMGTASFTFKSSSKIPNINESYNMNYTSLWFSQRNGTKINFISMLTKCSFFKMIVERLLTILKWWASKLEITLKPSETKNRKTKNKMKFKTLDQIQHF